MPNYICSFFTYDFMLTIYTNPKWLFDINYFNSYLCYIKLILLVPHGSLSSFARPGLPSPKN